MTSNPVTGIEPALRASDADREQAAELVRTGYADGRLTRAELDERLSAAYAAGTVAQLRGVTADLPGTRAADDGLPAPRPADEPGGAWFYDRCLIACLLVACPRPGSCCGSCPPGPGRVKRCSPSPTRRAAYSCYAPSWASSAPMGLASGAPSLA
jgi:hypothetical protein